MNDREMLIALLKENTIPEYWAEMIADHLLANGVVVRENGEWIKQEFTGCEPFYLCSVCETMHDEDYDFCNNCGSDMRKEENDDV